MPAIDNLPVDVLDTIFGLPNLCRPDLLAIALTNKRFHAIVIRHIYRLFHYTHDFDIFCTSLQKNVFYAEHVRIIYLWLSKATNPDCLKFLFSLSTVKLHELNVSCRDDMGLEILCQALQSPPDLAIHVTSVYLDIYKGSHNKSLEIFSKIGNLHGLEILYIARERCVETQEIINALCIPRLTTLKLQHGADTICPYLPAEDRLPNLRFLDLSFHFPPDAEWMSILRRHPTQVIWDSWTSMMERNISLTITLPGSTRLLPQSFSFLAHNIIIHARNHNLNPKRLIHWFTKNHSNRDYSKSLKWLPLQQFRPDDRNTFLDAIGLDSLPTVQVMGLEISLFESDRRVLLPHNVTHLSMDITQHISPDLIPTMIEPLFALRSLNVRLTFRGNGPYASGLEYTSSCTKTPLSIPPAVLGGIHRKLLSMTITRKPTGILWSLFLEPESRRGYPIIKEFQSEGTESCSWCEEMEGWVSSKEGKVLLTVRVQNEVRVRE
jgi:hypothetical protein